MKTNFLILFLFFCFTPDFLSAQTLELKPKDPLPPSRPRPGKSVAVPEVIQQKTVLFFSNLKKNKPRIAFFKLFDGTQFATEGNLIDKFVKGASASFEQYGPIQRYEMVSAEKPTERLFILTYVTELQTKFLRWRLLFFTPVGNEWKLVNLKIDDMREFLPSSPISSKPPSSVILLIENFFLSLQNNNVSKGFKTLLKDSKVSQAEEWQQLFIKKTNQALQDYGKMISYDLYDNRPIGSNIRILTYFSYLETEPLRWQFIFETPKNKKWKLINVRLDDLLDESLLSY